MRDLKSNETFFHEKYWGKFKPELQTYKKQMEGDDQNDSLLEFCQKISM